MSVSQDLYTIFSLDSEEYAASVDDVVEVIDYCDLTHVPNAPEFLLGITNLRGQIIPIIDLEILFGLKHQSEVDFKHYLISSIDGHKFGIRVGTVSEVKNIPPGAVSDAPSVVRSRVPADFLKGIYVNSEEDKNERVILILDLKKILSKETLEKIEKGGAFNERASL